MKRCEEVKVYTLDDIFLCKAECSEKHAFGDKAVGREHDRDRKQFVKATKAERNMSILEASQLMPEVEFNDKVQTQQPIEAI